MSEREGDLGFRLNGELSEGRPRVLETKIFQRASDRMDPHNDFDKHDWHDGECERELTSHGYTPCRCDLRAGICYCRKTPCECLNGPAGGARGEAETTAPRVQHTPQSTGTSRGDISRFTNTPYAELRKQRDELLTALKEATNGWACYAKRKSEHDEITRLHSVIRKVEERAR